MGIIIRIIANILLNLFAIALIMLAYNYWKEKIEDNKNAFIVIIIISIIMAIAL